MTQKWCFVIQKGQIQFLNHERSTYWFPHTVKETFEVAFAVRETCHVMQSVFKYKDEAIELETQLLYLTFPWFSTVCLAVPSLCGAFADKMIFVDFSELIPQSPAAWPHFRGAKAPTLVNSWCIHHVKKRVRLITMERNDEKKCFNKPWLIKMAR